jgi:hypothetical protein
VLGRWLEMAKVTGSGVKAMVESNKKFRPGRHEIKRHIGVLSNRILGERLYVVGFLKIHKTNEDLPVVIVEGEDDGDFVKHDEKRDESFFAYGGEIYYFELNGKLKKKQRINGLSEEGIKKILDKVPVDKDQIWKDLDLILKDYIDDGLYPAHYTLYKAYLVSTYLFNVIRKAIYLIFYSGEPDTGKSSRQRILALLQNRGFMCGDVSPAYIARVIHKYGACVNIDEYDNAPRDVQERLLKIINGGAYPDGTYGRSMMEKGYDDDTEWSTFGPKTVSLNTLHGIKKSTKSRSIIIPCLRNSRPIKDNLDLSEKDRQVFQDITDRIVALLLGGEWRNIQASIKEVRKDLEDGGIYGRDNDKISILVGIQKYFEGKEDLKDFLLIQRDWETDSEITPDREYYTAEYLIIQFNREKLPEKITIEIEEINEHVKKKMGGHISNKGTLEFLGKCGFLRRDKLLKEQKGRHPTSRRTTVDVYKKTLEGVLPKKRYWQKLLTKYPEDALNFVTEDKSSESFGSSATDPVNNNESNPKETEEGLRELSVSTSKAVTEASKETKGKKPLRVGEGEEKTEFYNYISEKSDPKVTKTINPKVWKYVPTPVYFDKKTNRIIYWEAEINRRIPNYVGYKMQREWLRQQMKKDNILPRDLKMAYELRMKEFKLEMVKLKVERALLKK